MKHPRTSPAIVLQERCEALNVRLGAVEAGVLVALLDRCFIEPQNLTAIRDLDLAIDRHLVDSLCALRLPVFATVRTLADIGSGVGFPGIALAVARPNLRVSLIESERSKADWLRRATAGLANVEVVHDRAELLALHRRGEWDIAVARAVGGLPTVLELAAPLLAEGGSALLWRGRRDENDEVAGRDAAATLGLTPRSITPLRLHDGSIRHLHEFTRTGIVPARFPRRPGIAANRPLAVRPDGPRTSTHPSK